MLPKRLRSEGRVRMLLPRFVFIFFLQAFLGKRIKFPDSHFISVLIKYSTTGRRFTFCLSSSFFYLFFYYFLSFSLNASCSFSAALLWPHFPTILFPTKESLCFSWFYSQMPTYPYNFSAVLNSCNLELISFWSWQRYRRLPFGTSVGVKELKNSLLQSVELCQRLGYEWRGALSSTGLHWPAKKMFSVAHIPVPPIVF